MALSRAVCRRLCECSHSFEDVVDEDAGSSWMRHGKPGWVCNFGRCQLWEDSAAPIGCLFILEHLCVTNGSDYYSEPLMNPYSIERESGFLVCAGIPEESVVF